MSDEPIIYQACNSPLVTQDHKSLIQAVDTFAKLVQRARGFRDGGSAIYQLDDCSRIDAGAILLLMHAGFLLDQIDWAAKVSGSGEAWDLVLRHLNNLLRYKSQDTRIAQDTADGNYLLRAIPKQEQMVSEISEWADTVRNSTNATASDVALWEFQISEVATNSFQHGTRPSVPHMLVAGSANAGKNIVQLASLDYGRSIPATIEKVFQKRDIHDGDKIQLATRQGVTSGSVKENQGAGLSSLVDTVKGNGGNLLILSRNGLFHVSNGRPYCRKLPPYHVNSPVLDGTLTIVNLRIS